MSVDRDSDKTKVRLDIMAIRATKRATKRTPDERLAELNKKIEQMQSKAKSYEQKIKADERKKRTKRLIAIGAEIEHYAGCDITNLTALKEYLKKYGYAIAATQKTQD